MAYEVYNAQFLHVFYVELEHNHISDSLYQPCSDGTWLHWLLLTMYMFNESKSYGLHMVYENQVYGLW